MESYINNKTGLLHCSTCKEAKESKLEIEGVIRIIPKACKCEREKFAKQELRKKKEELESYRAFAIETERYRRYTFASDNGLDKETSNMCRKYVINFKQLQAKGLGLLFYGSVGTGKTYYAHAIANALIDKGYRVKSTSLTNIIQLEFDKKQKELEIIFASEIIVLDDVGAERKTSYGYEKVYQFIDKVTLLNRILLLTTNLTMKEIKEMREDTSDLERARVFSRILEKCMPVKVNTVKQRELKEEANKKFMQEIIKGRKVF